MNASHAAMQSDLGFENRGQHARGTEPEILTEIYQDAVNIAVWETEISPKLESAVKAVMASSPDLRLSEVISVKSAKSQLQEMLGADDASVELRNDVLELVDMFCCLFGLQRTGLRLAMLNRAMCPRFHVDHVPCRLLKTYTGIATQWIPHDVVDRTKLGVDRHNQTDEMSGLFQSETVIENLLSGQVALLKGERWEGNEGAGLVHRSPGLEKGERRLLLSLDFC
ncbi:DUF1826 domain-containing protein [Litorivicinus sp.]|nr:DUF1826 domain-containing protein [Litorivicinus sp.]